MAGVELDVSEVEAFASDLVGVPFELARHAVPVLKRFAQDVKADVQADARSSSNAGMRKAGNFVSYADVLAGASGFETEVGYDKSGAGNLANIMVFGTDKGGGTHPHPADIAVWHVDAFESALADAAVEILS